MRWSRRSVIGFLKIARRAPEPIVLGWPKPWPTCVTAIPWWSGSWTGWGGIDLIDTVKGLDARHIGLHSLTEQVDTATPGGRLIFHVFGALGQFERDLIRERTRAGLHAAQARGRLGGRKPVVTEDKLRRVRDLIAKGLTVREAASRVRVGKTVLYKAL